MKHFLFSLLAYGLALNARAQSGGESVILENPIPGTTSLEGLIDKVINYLFIIATPIATIMALYAGFVILTGKGNPVKLKEGYSILKNIAIGYGVIICAKGVSLLVMEFLGVSQ